MIWDDCLELKKRLKNTHAFCGASNYHWRNYDKEKLIQTKINSNANVVGTLLHAYAADNIDKGFKIYKTDKRGVLRYLIVEHGVPEYAVDIDRLFPNLMNYVNDCIGYRMKPEVLLYYSDDFYGTTDAISWSNNVLRISDLKTGKSEPSFMQLENYAAFFCLRYKVKPSDIKKIEFRFYQDNEIIFAEPSSKILVPIIDQIIDFNNVLSSM